MALAVMASRSSFALQTLYSSLGGILNPLSKLVRIEGPGVGRIDFCRVNLGLMAGVDLVSVDASLRSIPTGGDQRDFTAPVRPSPWWRSRLIPAT